MSKLEEYQARKERAEKMVQRCEEAGNHYAANQWLVQAKQLQAKIDSYKRHPAYLAMIAQQHTADQEWDDNE